MFVFNINWRPPNLSELTLIIFNMPLIHLGLQFIYIGAPCHIYYVFFNITLHTFAILTFKKLKQKMNKNWENR